MTSTTLYPLDYHALAREALDGGFTQALDGWRPERGYVVSTRPDAERVVDMAMWPLFGTPKRVASALYDYVVEHGHDLRHGYLLGAWRTGDLLVLDLVQVFEERGEAEREARRNKQDAFYDVNQRVTVQVVPADEMAEPPVLLTKGYDTDWALDERRDLEAEAWQAQFDDDPNPYHGDYSEE